MLKRKDDDFSVPTTDGITANQKEDCAPGPLDKRALDDLFTGSYRELHRLACSIKRADANATISTATLVHETWMRLARSGSLTPESQLHLKRIVAQAMRRYVTEAARRRYASKRGGRGAIVFITIDDSMDLPVSRDQDLLALNDALEELARVNPRHASLVELRFYAGSDVAEAAQVLGIAEATAGRDWRAAKAWLASQMRRGHEGSSSAKA